MATEKVLGRQMILSINDIVVGCAQSVEFSSEVSMIDAACRESGSFYSGVPDVFTATISLEGLIMYDTPVDATAMRSNDIAGFHMAKTLIDFTLGPQTVGYKSWTGQGYITNYSETGEQEGVATYSATVQVVDEYSQETNA